MNRNELIRELVPVLLRHRLTLDQLLQTADEVIVFGSRARGLASPSSDWDILVIGSTEAIRSRELNLLTLSRNQLLSHSWLGSELASHVAEYGIWLKGDGAWRDRAKVSAAAISRKQRQLRARTEAYESLRRILSPGRRKHHATRLRRNLQRLSMLLAGVPMPTNPELDRAWGELSTGAREAILENLSATHDIGDTNTWRSILELDTQHRRPKHV